MSLQDIAAVYGAMPDPEEKKLELEEKKLRLQALKRLISGPTGETAMRQRTRSAQERMGGMGALVEQGEGMEEENRVRALLGISEKSYLPQYQIGAGAVGAPAIPPAMSDLIKAEELGWKQRWEPAMFEAEEAGRMERAEMLTKDRERARELEELQAIRQLMQERDIEGMPERMRSLAPEEAERVKAITLTPGMITAKEQKAKTDVFANLIKQQQAMQAILKGAKTSWRPGQTEEEEVARENLELLNARISDLLTPGGAPGGGQEITDRKLIDAAKRGDESAYEELRRRGYK